MSDLTTSSSVANSSSRRDFFRTSLSALAGITIVPRSVLGGSGFTPPSDRITLGYVGTGK